MALRRANVFILLFTTCCMAVQLNSHRTYNPRSRRCRYREIYYQTGQQVRFRIQRKQFDCTCLEGGRLDCTWTHITPPENTKCRDTASGQLKRVGEQWERSRNGRILDCVCNRRHGAMEVSCSDENRCHHNGVSYRNGAVFTTNSLSGRPMTCTCLEQKTLSCSYEEELPAPETDGHWVVNYTVFGSPVLRPQLTTLQACRTGAKVVTSGVVWNQTKTNALGVRTVEQCACVDAIVRCKTVRVVDKIEPHCISVDGRFRSVGQKWIRVPRHIPTRQFECVCQAHEDVYCKRVRRPRCVDDVDGTIRVAGDVWQRLHPTLPNLKFECQCNENKSIACRDIGECDEPSAPANGALFCANVGKHGPKQVMYCKPMCLSSYEFINTQRYYRIWEVCGPMNLHRWSGGFVADYTAIARCKERERGFRRGHTNLYLPTDDCHSLTYDQIEDLKTLFLRQLNYRGVCAEKCEITVFKCGEKD